MRSQDKKAELRFSELHYQVVNEFTESPRKSTNILEDNLKRIEFGEISQVHNKTILDCGCGPGKDAIVLAMNGNQVVGTDISSTAVVGASRLAKQFDVEVDFVVADSEHLPFRYEVFQLCCCFETLHHFPDPSYAVSEITSTLQVTGELLIFEPNGSNPIIRLSEHFEQAIRSWLVNTGLDTPNENIHPVRTYFTLLRRQNLRIIRAKEWLVGGCPPIPNSSPFLFLITRIRLALLRVMSKLLPRFMRGTDILIVGAKSLRTEC